MSIDGIKEIMDAFDPASLLPELDTITGKIELIARIAVMVGPILLLILGLMYLFLAPKEANHHFGYRCYFGMGSVDAWRFTQRLAGLIWGGLGLLLTIIMFIMICTFRGLVIMDLVWRAACCLFWQVGLVGAACLGINITAALRFDRKGEYRPKKQK
jgi:hypothetical protein